MEDERGREYSAFVKEMGLQLLNMGDTPTFETLRNGRMYTSVGKPFEPEKQTTTRVYHTNKAKWSDFALLFKDPVSAKGCKCRLYKGIGNIRPVRCHDIFIHRCYT